MEEEGKEGGEGKEGEEGKGGEGKEGGGGEVRRGSISEKELLQVGQVCVSIFMCVCFVRYLSV